MFDIISSFFIQAVFTIGIVWLFGFLIHLSERAFYRNFGNWGRKVCFVTGCIGTPIHECSHALFCLIFGHKIIEIKLFQWGSSDGTLGYVSHSYNKRNVYHVVGNFFIGVAPLLVITALLYLLAWWLVPEMLSEVFLAMEGVDVEVGFSTIFPAFGKMFLAIFSGASSGAWWVFILLGGMLCSHMALSGADIRSSIKGMLILLGILLAVNVILRIVGADVLATFTNAVTGFGVQLASLLCFSLIISLLMLLISFLVRIIFKK